MAKLELLLGDDAVALGALHAGISGAYSYPGTPATEILEYVEAAASRFCVKAAWAANEKVAYEEALGMSYAGKRALVSMKHVGLNVAADPFLNSGVTGVNGGLVVCVADDPGMHSSQNEQDSRYYAHFAQIPCFEPANQQQAYDMTRQAFDLSEALGVPVMVRLVTRLAHSRSDVVVGEPRPQNHLRKQPRGGSFTLLPTNARVQYKGLTEKYPRMLQASEESTFNLLGNSAQKGGADKAVITNGIAYNYVREAFSGTIPFPSLHICQYPTPVGLVRQLVDLADEIYVIEEGYPYIEEALRGLMGVAGKRIRGKLDSTLPRTGELNPAMVAKIFGMETVSAWKPIVNPLPNRPPKLCPGCPHIDTFEALNEALSNYSQPTVTSDIGCYTLGYYPPYEAIETCVDMGASVSMAIGAVHAGLHPVVCTIGDSTFIHSGMTGLISAVRENLNMKVLILDNATVAMTGTQETMATGEALDRVVLGLGVDPGHMRVFVPHPRNRAENVALLREELAYEGLSVLIARRPCIQIRRK